MILDLRCTHLAVTLEDSAFLDDELLRLDVAHELGRVLEDELARAVDIASDSASNDGRGDLDFAFNTARAFHDEVALDIHATLDVTSHADVALAEDVALDGDAVADLCDFLFFIWHSFS